MPQAWPVASYSTDSCWYHTRVLRINGAFPQIKTTRVEARTQRGGWLLVKTGVRVLLFFPHRSAVREEAHATVFHEVENARRNLSKRGAVTVCVCV